MPEHVDPSDALTFLALVPELIGFDPRSSLVLITFQKGRSGGTLRVDLPPPHDCADESRTGESSSGDSSTAELRRLATTLIGLVCKVRGADAVFAVTYSDHVCRGRPAAGDLVLQLRRAAQAAGFPMLGALFVAADGWGDYEGARRGDRASLEAALRARRAGRRWLRAFPRDEAALPAVEHSQAARTTHALAALRESREPPDPIWFAEYTAGWRPEEIGPAGAALAAHVLENPWARDVALCTWAWGMKVGERALRFQERGARGEPIDDEEIAMALAGRAALPRPSSRRVERVIMLLREVAARLAERDRAPVLVSLAWLSWALGRGTIAGVYLEGALAADPRHTFARLLSTMLGSGVLPEWVFLPSVGEERAPRLAGGGRPV